MNPGAHHRPRFSVIVPVYNRPREIDELLASLTQQQDRDFEVIVVEDGSSDRCDDVIAKYGDRLSISYFFKPNSGPRPSRNFGFNHARGDYFVVFDSDCIIPPGYFNAVRESLGANSWDAWGGPDRGHRSFTDVQRAMGYTMSSVLTTGGIRGGKKRLGWFQPRSFNMGISRRAFELTGGFRFARYAEDIEFSIRMRDHGLKIGLIPEAFVYHKRRTNFSQFFRQVYNFGRGRVLVGKAYPSEIKLTHWFPALFVASVCALPLTAFISLPLFVTGLAVLLAYFTGIFVDAYRSENSFRVAALSVPAAWLQLWGYGTGFLAERFGRTEAK